MGEMADYILNGDDCQGCGEYLGEGDGYPRYCRACLREMERPVQKTARVRCSLCSRTVKETGLYDHMRDVHKRKPA